VWNYTVRKGKSIFIFAKDTKLIQELKGHTGPVLNIIDINNTVFSSSEDKTIRVWDAKVRMDVCAC
jgi:WD40 repeat protein